MLNADNFINYAMRHYDNPSCRTLDIFTADVNRISYIKRLLTRLSSGEDVNLRLILNHFISFFNVFDHDAALAMLFFKVDQDKWSILKTFLCHLQYMPDHIIDIGLTTVDIVLVESLKEDLLKI